MPCEGLLVDDAVPLDGKGRLDVLVPGESPCTLLKLVVLFPLILCPALEQDLMDAPGERESRLPGIDVEEEEVLSQFPSRAVQPFGFSTAQGEILLAEDEKLHAAREG